MHTVLDAIVRNLVRLLPSEYRRRLSFAWSYRRGTTPWDTGVPPPEVVDFVRNHPPGRALDLGCGTGTNVIYLARHGWDSTGVDYVPAAIMAAEQKVAALSLPARFLQGDVTRLADAPIEGPFNYLLDIGCLHGLPSDGQERYAAQIAALAAPGACYMLYAGLPHRTSHGAEIGITPERVHELFSPYFAINREEMGADSGAGWQRGWYWMSRHEPATGVGDR